MHAQKFWSCGGVGQQVLELRAKVCERQTLSPPTVGSAPLQPLLLCPGQTGIWLEKGLEQARGPIHDKVPIEWNPGGVLTGLTDERGGKKNSLECSSYLIRPASCLSVLCSQSEQEVEEDDAGHILGPGSHLDERAGMVNGFSLWRRGAGRCPDLTGFSHLTHMW